MASAFLVQGWCPTAWQPMRAHDGWLVRVRPQQATLRVAQWRQLADLAECHANGQLELTRLGNVQLRAVPDAAVAPLRQGLVAAALVHGDPEADAAPAVHCSPFHHTGDRTHQLAQALSQAVATALRPDVLRAAGLTPLPSKFSLLVDNPQQHLRRLQADLRIWPLAQGYALALGSAPTPTPAPSAGSGPVWLPELPEVVAAAVGVARWFAQARLQRQPHPTRLAALLPDHPPPLHGSPYSGPDHPLPTAPEPPQPGQATAWGLLAGAPLGRIDTRHLRRALGALPPAAEVRVTPWRSLLFCGADRAALQLTPDDARAWILDADDARLRVSACTGAPGCTQALATTQAPALRWAPQVPAGKHLHVSGCAKRCALPADADALACATLAESDTVSSPPRSSKNGDNPILHDVHWTVDTPHPGSRFTPDEIRAFQTLTHAA
ncbi:nitrite reductase [Comamonas serinivorans]|nr:nitrite reductase [Comamonas serinivorans]